MIECSDTANGSANTASSSGTLSGTLNSCESCAGISSRVAAVDVARGADVDAGRDRPDVERVAEAEVADLARRAHRRDAARPARQPRVQHDPVADLEAFGLGPERDDVGDDLVPEHLRQREEPLHRVVGRAHLAPVHEHLLGVGAADAGEARAA